MTTYRSSGVDLEGAETHVSRISEIVTATWSEHVIGGFGGFAAGVTIPDGFSSPVLMMSTDGVGTKLEIARSAGEWSGVGFDLVAMCVDDLAAAGAQPLGFVDYLAVGELHPERDRIIVESIAKACREAGCALLGGETAVHPGVMEPDVVDLAGAAMGVVENGSELGPHRVEPGQVVLGLSSPNLRSNGFSLVRAVLGEEVRSHAAGLLQPSVIYSPAVMAAVATGAVFAAAHITGGGLVANLARAIPDSLGTTIDTSAWHKPAVFDLIANRGVPEAEMFSVFNMGIGFALVIAPDSVDLVIAATEAHAPTVIGAVTREPGVRLA